MPADTEVESGDMAPPERWLVLEVPAPSDGEDAARRRRALVEALVALGGAGVEERDDRLRTYVAPPDDVGAWLGRARARLAAAVDPPAPEPECRWIEARDWGRAWRRGLEPRRVGHRVVVAPTWTDPEPDPGDVVVELDPGMAFGTGEHGTTRGALRLLEQAVERGDRVLDVGTGSGVLAIAAAGLGAQRVVAIDRDDGAVRTAEENAVRNDVGGRVELLHLEATPATVRLLGPPVFDVIAANLLTSRLLPLLGPFRAASADDGRLILGGILGEEADEMTAAAAGAGWRLEQEDRDEGWWTGLFSASPRWRPPRRCR